jgi:hypothetical protein
MKKICKNCKLFDVSKNECRVIILHEGEKINIPVEAQDLCFFETENYFNPISNQIENFNEIKEIKIWVEDESGNKSTNGIVKIEYPKELDMYKDI